MCGAKCDVQKDFIKVRNFPFKSKLLALCFVATRLCAVH